MAESRDRLLAGRYRLMHEIGRGGMGTVWWALDEAAGREVAVKEVHLPPSLSPRERLNLLKRTDREAMAARRLHHPNLIAMYDVVVEEHRPWLVMEYVAARSLEDVFVDDGPISPPRVADIGRQLLDALSAVHAIGIVHRDVKPSNVLLEPSGRVVLTDFGIATYDGATTLTQSGSFMGSPAYVAPEVARGERATPAADLWSLGATLYAAVEGRPPYDHDTAMATLSALVTCEPDPPVRAGPLRPLLDGLLQKDPTRRLTIERAAELLAAATPPPLPPAPPGRRATWRTDRRPDGAERYRHERVAASPAAPYEPPAAPANPGEAGRSRRLLDRPGVLPAVSGGVLALAVAAGVVAGLRGWAGPRPGTTADRPSSATGTPDSTATVTAPPPSVSSTGGPDAALPETLRDPSGGPAGRKVAERGGVWPGAAALTLTVPDRGHRVRVLVVCRAGAGRLSFTASAVGGAGGTVSGVCVPAARGRTGSRTLRLPGRASHARIRVRVRPGPKAGGGPVAWLAGAYEAPGA